MSNDAFDDDGLFSFDVRVGLLFTVEGASLSIASAAFILGLAFQRWLRRKANEIPRPSDASDSSLFLNLMVADLIQWIGVMPNIKWMNDARITEGSMCTAQAVLKQIGIVGVALTSLMIAIHTFAVLVGRWREPVNGQKYMVVAVWICTALIIGIPNAVHHEQKYYGPAQYWCWIPRDFPVEQVVTEYLWVWVAGTSMAVLYGIMFATLKRSASKLKDLARETNARESDEDAERTRRTKNIAYSLLFYPAVYIAYIFPNSLARWMYFQNVNNVPVHFTFFANTIFALGGVFNLMLFLMTRREVVVGPQAHYPHHAHSPTSPSFPRQSAQRIASPPSSARKTNRAQGANAGGYPYQNRADEMQQHLSLHQHHHQHSSSLSTPDIEKLSHRSDASFRVTVPEPPVPGLIYETPRKGDASSGVGNGRYATRRPASQRSVSSRDDDEGSSEQFHLPAR